MKNSLLLFLIASLSLTCNPKRTAIQKTEEKVPSFCGPSDVDLDTEPGHDGTLSPLFEGLDVLEYPISTENELCQKYFNQGLVLAFGFNHAEAARSFREAAKQDPNCAMCYWGIAWVLGPNYNAPTIPATLYPRIWDNIMKAKLRLNYCSEKEKALISAIEKRYPKTGMEDAGPFNEDFAKAMKQIHKKYPDDLELAAITAEALMNLHPWDMFDPNDKSPREWTSEIVSLVEKILREDPDHFQGIHLYIHALESSPYPEKVIPFADKLVDMVPGSGHLIHMPSHTYINTGDYHKGTMANQKAVLVDSAYVAGCHEAGIYPLGYYPHNWHFLAGCAALEGRGEQALEASQYMSDYVVDHELMLTEEDYYMQHFYSIPWYIMVKFAKWDEILKIEKQKEELVYPRVIRHYARGMAYAAKNELDKANAELEAVKILEKDTVLVGKKFFNINEISKLVYIARYVLDGEIAFRNGESEKSIKLYKAAVKMEDSLKYNEPPDWFFSVRHLLGHVLMKAEKYAEAEKVYLEDLQKLKKNGWALMGLYQSLKKQNKDLKAEKVKEQYDEAWRFADAQLTSSVI